jgi:hypothetical protein
MPKVKIVGMPTVRIVDLPKALLGLEVDDTTTMDPALSSTQAPADKPRDINNCIIGEEQYDLATGVCVPIDGGYDSKQDEQKNQPAIPVTNSSGQTVGGPASTGKTGPGTGVNPSQIVKPGECAKGLYKDSKGNCVPDKKGIQAVNDVVQASLAAGNAIARVVENKQAKTAAEASMRRKSWASTVKPGGAMAFGKTQLNEGIEFPNMMAPPNDGQYMGNYFGRSMGQFGGSFPTVSSGPIKIKIVGEPDSEVMKYGGQSGYGFDSGWKRSYTEMNKISSDYYKNSMSEDKSSDEEPVLEAEGGETIYKPGDQAFFRLNGPKHSQGGIELTGSQVNSKTKDVPSFIYSDTPSLKIKDKNTLEHFGVTYKKGGVTPAEISKKYDLNKFKAILQDPNSDELAKSTAQLMIDKNERRLAELATVQEKMKGLKAPKFAEQTLKEGSAAFGGFMPTYAEGGVTDTTTKPPSEGGIFTPEQIKAFGKDKVIVSERVKAGDTKVLKHQGATAGDTGTYGGITQNEVEELKKRHPWYFSQHPNWNPKNEDDVGDFQESYNEKYAKKHGYQYFVPKGSTEDRKFNRFDKKLGEYTYNAPAIEQDVTLTTTIPVTQTTTIPVTEPRYMCYPNLDGKGGGTVKQLPAGMTGGYSSPEEAAKYCPGPPKKGKFDYLLPDKLNMFAHAAIFPRQIFPFNPDLAFNPRPLALEDWRVKAAQRFSTQYAAPAAQLAQFGPTQGLGANLSFLAGQTGQQMAAEDIAPTISRNIDRVNAYNTSEGQRQDTIDAFNNQNKVKRWEGYATTLQNYDNAMRGYLKENSDAFTRAWKNRMHLGEINDTNPNFLMDATTGRQTWKGNAYYTGNTNGGDSDLGKMYSLYYQKNMEDMSSYITDEAERKKAARDLAMKQIDADRYSDTTDPYTNRRRRRSSGFDFDNN